MVDHGARFVGFAGCGGVDGDAVRSVTGVAPGQPVQPGSVAHNPTPRGRYVEALGPPRGVAGAQQLQRRRVPVRGTSGHRRSGDPRRRRHQFSTRREIHHRCYLRHHPSEHPTRKLGFWVRVETRVWIRFGFWVGPVVDVQRVCDVGDGGR